MSAWFRRLSTLMLCCRKIIHYIRVVSNLRAFALCALDSPRAVVIKELAPPCLSERSIRTPACALMRVAHFYIMTHVRITVGLEFPHTGQAAVFRCNGLIKMCQEFFTIPAYIRRPLMQRLVESLVECSARLQKYARVSFWMFLAETITMPTCSTCSQRSDEAFLRSCRMVGRRR